jgi:hypothetical protein
MGSAASAMANNPMYAQMLSQQLQTMYQQQAGVDPAAIQQEQMAYYKPIQPATVQQPPSASQYLQLGQAMQQAGQKKQQNQADQDIAQADALGAF